MILIAALGRNHVIGCGDEMPWSVPDEYRMFLDFIRGQTVIIGRRSWEIFGADLTSTHNVVLSRSLGELPGATIVGGLEAALEVARGFGSTVFCAGGARVYAQALPHAEAMYLSWIEGRFEGDAHFPQFDESAWRVSRREPHPAFEFVVYDRTRPA